jgi:hypothetical protein
MKRLYQMIRLISAGVVIVPGAHRLSWHEYRTPCSANREHRAYRGEAGSG